MTAPILLAAYFIGCWAFVVRGIARKPCKISDDEQVNNLCDAMAFWLMPFIVPIALVVFILYIIPTSIKRVFVRAQPPPGDQS